MNSCWRPRKGPEVADLSPGAGRNYIDLGLMSLGVMLIGSNVPALVLSYFTPKVGFSCRLFT